MINANAVVRADEMIYTIEDTHSSKLKVKHAITLLNENASDYRIERIAYDEFSSVAGIRATVYDSKGEIILTAKPEIYDVSANYGELASDNRYWVISYPVRKYPYTVEVEYEKTIKESFFYENWSFQSQPDVSVQQSGIQYIVPKEMVLRVKESNLKHKCDTVSLEDKNIYTWQEENLPAYKKSEQFLLSFEKKSPVLLVAPAKFSMGGLDGSMNNWQDFGKWHYDLNKNRDIISPELQAKLKNLISSTSDTREQVKRIYEYLQKNTRYVSIQLGIGGFQTLEAGFVEKKGYGDCKALTNFMKSLLKSVGIYSQQALVLAGENEDIFEDFPSQQFNHVILCVPVQKDTIWLECTSQTQPFNFLGSFTDDRQALLLTEQGGKMIRTPKYGLETNLSKTNLNVSVDFLGNARVGGKLLYSGLLFEQPYDRLEEGKKAQEKWVNSIFEATNVTINKLDYSKVNDFSPGVEVKCDIQLRDFVSKTSKRMVFNPNLFTPVSYVAKFADEEFEIPKSKENADFIVFTLPFGYKCANIPDSEKIESKYGSYKVSYQVQGDKLIYNRDLIILQGKFHEADKEPFMKFANKVAKLDRRLVVLQKE